MKIAILYDSATGNTAYLAEALHKAYPDAVLCTPDTCAVADAEHCVLLGFWTDKGHLLRQAQSCCLPQLAGKQVFLLRNGWFRCVRQLFLPAHRPRQGRAARRLSGNGLVHVCRPHGRRRSPSL